MIDASVDCHSTFLCFLLVLYTVFPVLAYLAVLKGSRLCQQSAVQPPIRPLSLLYEQLQGQTLLVSQRSLCCVLHPRVRLALWFQAIKATITVRSGIDNLPSILIPAIASILVSDLIIYSAWLSAFRSWFRVRSSHSWASSSSQPSRKTSLSGRGSTTK